MAAKKTAAPSDAETPTNISPEAQAALDAEATQRREHVRKNRRIALGIVMAVAAYYLLISTLSYYAFWKADENLLEHVLSSAGADEMPAENWGGKVGNYVASVMVRQWFGVAAILLPIALLLVALRLLRLGFGRRRTWKLCIISLLGALLASATFGLLPLDQTVLGSGLGGAHGAEIASWMKQLVGTFGSAAILVLLWFATGCYAIPHFPGKVKRAVASVLSLFVRRKKTPEAAQHSNVNAAQNASPNIADAPDERCDAEVGDGDTDGDVGNDDGEPKLRKKREKKDADEVEMEVDFHADDDDADVSEPSNGATSGNDTPDANSEEALAGAAQNGEILLDANGIPMQVAGMGDVPQTEAQLASLEPYDPKADIYNYQYPTPDLLNEPPKSERSEDEMKQELEENKRKIIDTLRNYGIEIAKIKASVGPTVTLYEIIPAPGVRISKIRGLEDDIALSLAALGIRIIAPMPGKGTVGIEVPNQKPEIVPMQTLIKSKAFQESKAALPIALGKTITNEAFIIDLAKMPHLLIAGATGQGKSVGLNAVLVSLLYKMHPSQLKLVLVDPKKVELPPYTKIENHFLAALPDADKAIITDNKKVIYTINSLCIEMDDRYSLLEMAGVRNIKEYNEKFIARKLLPTKGHRYLPYIVLVIDEFADLIMTAGKEVETPIARLAQLARAIGIHLIIATQRPTTNIITGLIKANFPARIAFRVTSMIDSRTILDASGAQNLIGKGDMLVSTGADLVRVQCAFVDTPEVEKITEFIARQSSYGHPFPLPEYTPPDDDGTAFKDVDLSKRDKMFDEAARLIVESQSGSTSLIQRKLELGYNRAGKIMDQLEAAGIVGPQEGSKPRQVRVMTTTELDEILGRM